MPDSLFIFYNRANLHIALGDWNLAIADLKKCLNLQPDAHTRAAIEKRLAEVTGGPAVNNQYGEEIPS